MITRQELMEAIEECENGKPSYQTCQKLATFYTLYDHMYGEPAEPPVIEASTKNVIELEGESDFMRAVSGRDGARMWSVMDELMETLRLINPRLYDGVMRRVTE